jgi:1,2-dihydroxy-3-keto-5-methylthiopentene dioxygenase
MSALSIYPAEKALDPIISQDFAAIQASLKELGVQFERWQADFAFAADADAQTVLDAYQASINELKQSYGFQSVDVINVKPDHPNKEQLRGKFLSEHVHDDFEIRFFIEGQGLFYLHIENQVYAVLCEQGDLISVPAHTPHWFDMGAEPDFKCIRFFTTEEGWLADFTGSNIGESFPTLEQYKQSI